jgi:hypothetical protein
MKALLCMPLMLVLTACGDSSGDSGGAPGEANDGVSPTTYVASTASFQNFRSWRSMRSEGPPGITDGINPTQPRTAYLNQAPPHGSTSFPTGTIIVKEFEGPSALTDRRVFALVKRGGGYDSAGAVGWEWFELKNLDATNVEVVWRGVVPPAGEAYAPGSATCNDCHGNAKGNDYVWTTALSLSSF